MQDTWQQLPDGHHGAPLAKRLREAQRQLQERPRLSIQVRLLTSLAFCFCLCVAFAFSTREILGTARTRVRILQAIEGLDSGAHAARAGARDSRRDRERTAERIESARIALRAAARDVPEAERPEGFAALRESLERYGALVAGPPASGTAAKASEAAALRSAERRIVAAARRLAARERAAVERALWIAETLPVWLLAALLLAFGLIAFYFSRALRSPIRRFQEYTRRIAAGETTLIRPVRPYRDEFSDLALAVNRMLAEIRTNQERYAQTSRLAALGTIASGIAHELNNPLNNVYITTESFMEDFKELDDEEKWKLLQDIYFETERAGEIVRSLLDFTRAERADMVPLDVRDVVLGAHRLAHNEMALGNVKFACEIPTGLPRIKGAPNQLKQVFLNLLLNAALSMPDGGSVTVASVIEDDRTVCVEVRDDGPGIPPDVLTHIFDPFFTTREPGSGTGLGLSVSLGIIKRHGGDIHATSEPGHGAVFHVCLPRADADLPAAETGGTGDEAARRAAGAPPQGETRT